MTGVDVDWLERSFQVLIQKSSEKVGLIFVKGMNYYSLSFLEVLQLPPELGNPVFYQPGFYGLVASNKH